MATIDILCVIDTNGLQKAMMKSPKTGTKEAPTLLGTNDTSGAYVFMIADGQFVDNKQKKNGQASPELLVNAKVGDTLRWTITDPSTGLISGSGAESYSCILYKFDSLTGSYKGIITEPSLTSVPAISYYNSLTDNTKPAAAAYMSSAWTSSVLKNTNATLQYDWSFQIVDNASGSVVGYYKWDPFIKISN